MAISINSHLHKKPTSQVQYLGTHVLNFYKHDVFETQESSASKMHFWYDLYMI